MNAKIFEHKESKLYEADELGGTRISMRLPPPRLTGIGIKGEGSHAVWELRLKRW
jgi:hypothetical protein